MAVLIAQRLVLCPKGYLVEISAMGLLAHTKEARSHSKDAASFFLFEIIFSGFSQA